MFLGLLMSMVNASNHTKCISLNNQKYIIQLTLMNLHRNEYSQEFHYYPFTVKLDRCIGSCNTPNDLSNKVCVPNKTEDLNQGVFSMIRGIYELKTSTKHIPCECKYKFDGRKCNSDQCWNNDKCRCEYRKSQANEKQFGTLLREIVKMLNIKQLLWMIL